MTLSFRSGTREAIASAWAHKGSSVVVALVALAMTAATFLTAGRAAATEASVLASVDEAGPRLLTVNIANPAPGLDEATVQRIEELPGTEWVLALGAARDVRALGSSFGNNVAARTLLSPLPDLVMQDLGRMPLAGEAIIGRDAQERLQLAHPSGSIVDGGGARAIVGRFVADGALTGLGRLALVSADRAAAGDRATLLYILAEDATSVAPVERAVRSVAGVPLDQLTVETSPELVDLSAVVSGAVGAFGRQLAIGAMLAGLVLISLTMILAMNSRRRDIGRRRALGASRSAIMALTLAEVAIPSVGGVAIGACVSASALVAFGEPLPSLAFTGFATLLLALAGMTAAAPPAMLAARQEPVRILRVP